MASENIKIKIQEVDLTKPGGAGIAPSDIAFVPGFSIKADAPQNIPVLCNDIYEFEAAFGKEPRILTSRDVEGYENYGFIAGSFDKSYIYAKELLYLGMPVIYSNIVNTHNVEHPDVSEVKCTDNENIADYISLSAYNQHEGSIKITGLQNFDDSATLRFVTKVVATKGKTNIPTITTVEIEAVIPDEAQAELATVVKTVLSVDTTNEAVSVVNLSNNQLEFTNTSTKDIECEVAVDVKLKFTIDFDPEEMGNNWFELILSERPSSALDVFYQSSANDESCIIGEHNDNIYDQLTLISDKSIYSVKYITSGGYPSVVSQTIVDNGKDKFTARKIFADAMLEAAAYRGDAVALIDYQRNETDKPFDTDPDSGSFYAKIHEQFNDVANAEFGAMMYPWGQFSCGATLGRVEAAETTDVYMPGSFSYMKCLAKAIKTSPNWLAMAGVTRGLVPGLKQIMTPHNVLSNTLAEEMQPKFGYENHRISINCITNIRPYGLTLWGNRTLKPVSRDGCVALNFLNTRNMLSDIKKVLYSTAKSLMFEQNSDTLWLRFKAGITPLLNQLKTGNGISDYKIVKGTTKYNGDPLQKGELAAVIKIYPIYAVEYFELTVELNDEEVNVF